MLRVDAGGERGEKGIRRRDCSKESYRLNGGNHNEPHGYELYGI
jgi:hypothetical protein